MKFRKKPVVIDAITFAELVAHGIAAGGHLINGMPWSFDYAGHPVTHETDDCYLIPTLEGTMKMTPSDMLITGVKGEIYPCKADIFAATYDEVTEVTADAGPSQHRRPLDVVKAGDRVIAYSAGAPRPEVLGRIQDGRTASAPLEFMPDDNTHGSMQVPNLLSLGIVFFAAPDA